MTRVCLVGAEDVELRYELVSRETAREALATYDLREPYENTVAVETVSLGSAVALLNDLNWYLVRFAEEALVFDPSVADEEWLSRNLAEAVRDGWRSTPVQRERCKAPSPLPQPRAKRAAGRGGAPVFVHFHREATCFYPLGHLSIYCRPRTRRGRQEPHVNWLLWPEGDAPGSCTRDDDRERGRLPFPAWG